MSVSGLASLPQGRFGNNRWVMYSRKNGRLVICYSNLERDHAVLAEMDNEVMRYTEQPIPVYAWIAGQRISTRFDMWVKLRSGGEEFREVKYEREIREGGRAVRQIRSQRSWCAEYRHQYRLVTDTDVYRNPIYLSNCKQILNTLGAGRVNDGTMLWVRRIIAELKDSAVTVGNLAEILDVNPHELRLAVATAIYDGCVGSDIERQKLGSNTELRLI